MNEETKKNITNLTKKFCWLKSMKQVTAISYFKTELKKVQILK